MHVDGHSTVQTRTSNSFICHTNGLFSLSLWQTEHYLPEHVCIIKHTEHKAAYVHSVTHVARVRMQKSPVLASAPRIARKLPADAGGSEGSDRLNCTEGTCVLVQAGSAALQVGRPSATLYLQNLKISLVSVHDNTVKGQNDPLWGEKNRWSGLFVWSELNMF